MVWSKIDNTVTEPVDYLFKLSFIRIALNEIISGTGINVICVLIASGWAREPTNISKVGNTSVHNGFDTDIGIRKGVSHLSIFSPLLVV